MSQETEKQGDRLNQALDDLDKLVGRLIDKGLRQVVQGAADVVEAINRKLQS